nr:hypothetical protein [Myxococcales bacterium]
MGWLLAWTMMTASALTLQFLPSDAYFSTEAADIEWATPTVMLRYERIESWFMACGTAGFTTLTVTHVDPRDVAAIRDAVRRADRWFVPTEAQPERPRIGIADPVFVLLVDRRADLDQYRPGRRYNEQIQEDVTATAAHAVDHTFEIDTHAAAVPHLQFTAAPRMERTDHE